MTTTKSDTRLRLTRVLSADPGTVFAAWTEADRMERWFSPEGVEVVSVVTDPVPGGAYRVRMRSDEGNVHTARGTYREVDPPVRLVFTWEWEEEEHAVGETVVTVELTEIEGGTELVLTHEGFPAAEARDGHAEGWRSCLDRLEAYLP